MLVMTADSVWPGQGVRVSCEDLGGASSDPVGPGVVCQVDLHLRLIDADGPAQARALFLSEKTVKSHVSNLLRK